MASHCHSTHHHFCHPTTTCCHCCSTPSHHLTPPPEQPLIIQCGSLHPTPPQSHPFTLQTHHHQQKTQYYCPPQTHKQKRHSQKYPHLEEEDEEEEETNPMISSLLRRISALESSIRHHSTASFSLRDAAARTIQTHFRAFLVRRSRTLRQLKDLSFIKAALNTLKSSHSNNTHSDSRALSHKAVDLLNKLNSIQGGDPMIRDGKRSVKRELIRFMDYLDELSMRRHQISRTLVKNVRPGGSGTKSRGFHYDQRMSTTDSRGLKGGERELLQKLRKRVEKIEGFSRVYEENEEEDLELENARTRINGKSGVSQTRNGVLRQAGIQAKTKKNVTFDENGDVYIVYKRANWPDSESNSNDGSDSVDAEDLGREVEEIGTGDEEEEAHSDDNELPQISDEDRDPRRNVVTESDPIENEDGRFVFSAPLPVKMESRADHMNKKTVKIVN